MRLFLVLVFLVLSLGPAPSVQAAPAVPTSSATMELIGHIGGPSNGVAVRGSVAYLGLGVELAVIDISEPSHPQRIGYTLVYDDLRDVTSSGSLALAAGHGLHVIDVSRPQEPEQIGSWNGPDSLRVAAAGERVYLLHPDNISVLDITHPSRPALVSAFPGWVDKPFTDLALSADGQKAFITWGYCDRGGCSGGLLVMSAGSEGLSLLGTIDIQGAQASNLAVNGNYVFFEANGLHVVNISDPAQPLLNGFCADCTSGVLLKREDGDFLMGEHPANISNPAQPVWLGDCPTCTGRSAVSGGFAFFAPGYEGLGSGGVGLQVVDISDLSHPRTAGVYRTLAAEGLAVRGRMAYLFQAGRLGIVDVDQPSNPQVSSFDLPLGVATDIELVGRYAIISSYDGLIIVDVDDPNQPRQIGSVPAAGSGYQALAQWQQPDGARLVAVAAREEGLLLFDLSDPHQPRLLGQLLINDPVSGVYVRYEPEHGRMLAYVTGDAPGGLSIVDISTPAQPLLLGTCSACSGQKLALSGDYAYVIDWEFGLRVVDVSEPTLPVQVGQYWHEDSFLDLALSCNRVYLAAPWEGLYMLDVSDPYNPQSLGIFNTKGNVFGVQVSDGLVYSVNYVTGGLFITRPAQFAKMIAGEPGQIPFITEGCGRAELQYGAKAVNNNVVVNLASPLLDRTQPFGLSSAGHSFTIQVAPMTSTENFYFTQPVTVTLNYNPADLGAVRSETGLTLYQEVGGAWQPAAVTCAAAATIKRDLLQHNLQIPLCQTGRYSLLGPVESIALPLLVH